VENNDKKHRYNLPERSKLHLDINRHEEGENLFILFENLTDFRRAQGRMYKLSMILIIVTMAIMSGYHSQRAMGDFIRKHWRALILFFKPRKKRMPSYQTIGRVISRIDFKELSTIFYKWSKSYVKIDKGDYLSIDGKVIGGTVTNPHNSLQEYVNLVSLFSHKRKQILALDKVEGKKSEINTVKNLIKQLDLEGITLTLDALHCQKETVKAIIKSKNDYIIGVKGNQKNLYKQIQETIEQEVPVDIDISYENSRGRKEKRISELYKNLNNISSVWTGLKSIIKIERVVERDNKNTSEIAYYISSLSPKTSAKEFNRVIRNHWLIENSLHYVKDKTFREDASKIRKGSAPQNLSIIRNVAINIFRKHGYKNMAQAIRLVSDDLRKIYQMILA
jgi:predicted transposase YbfD/YdcC